MLTEVQSVPSIKETHMTALSHLYMDGLALLMYQAQDGNITAYLQIVPGGEWNATIEPSPDQ
jgi:hypothetical protein